MAAAIVIQVIWDFQCKDCISVFKEQDWRAIDDMFLDRLNFPSRVSLIDGKRLVSCCDRGYSTTTKVTFPSCPWLL